MEKRDVLLKLASYENKGITFWVEGEKLKYRTKVNVLGNEDVNFLKENKQTIMEILIEKENKKNIEFTINEKDRFEPFPLTDVQQAYLLGRSKAFDYGNIACHIYMKLEYDELDVKKVEDIWNQLIAKHDMLRVQIYKNGYQQVLEKVDWFTVKEYSEEKEEELYESMGHRVYDTEKWPLFDLAVSKGKEKSVLHFSIEFLIADWTSIWMLLSEFEGIYFDGKIVEPATKLNFRDYVIAEKKMRDSDEYKQSELYWMERVKDFSMAPKLPILEDQNEEQVRFQRYNVGLNIEEWNVIKKKANEYGVTPTAVILKLYAGALALYSQNKKFAVNLTVLNRLPLFDKIKEVIGDFTSVSLLEVDEENKAFLDGVKEISRQLFEDLDHRLFSGVEMMREIIKVKGKDAAFMPYVFTSAIGLLNSNGQGLLRGKNTGDGISQTPQVFIDCQVMDGDFGLQVNWDVREGVFQKEVINSLFEIFKNGLQALALEDSNWNQFLIDIPSTQKAVIEKANDTKKEIKTVLLHKKIVEYGRKNPNKVAIVDNEQEITYGTLLDTAQGIYKELKNNGVNEGDCVCIVMRKSYYQIASALAILAAKAIYVPIAVDNPYKRTENIINQTNAAFYLSLKEDQPEYLYENVKRINVDTLSKEKEALPIEGNIENVAYIIFTSGSTGEPKGVVIHHKGASNTIEDINQRLQVTDKDTIIGVSELNFDLSVYDIFGILSAGGTLVLPSGEQRKDPSYLAKLLNKYQVTLWNSVPAYMQILMDYVKEEKMYSFNDMRAVMLSGDYIPLELPEECKRKMPNTKIYSLGGATEASIWSIIYEYEGKKSDYKTIPYGKPLANQGFKIIGADGKQVPLFVDGELCITGDGVALGYYQDEIRTKEAFVIDKDTDKIMYRTGDFGKYHEDGTIEFMGRRDEQIKLHGHRIELGEIEKGLLENDAIDKAVAIIDGDGEEKKLVAFVQSGKCSEMEVLANEKEWKETLQGCDDESDKLVEDISKDFVEKLVENRDEVLLLDMTRTLNDLIFHNQKVREEEIVQSKVISEKYHWLVGYWLKVLVKKGWILKTDDFYYVNPEMDICKETSERKWKGIRENTKEGMLSPVFAAYLENSANNLSQLLTGELDAIKVLYPDGNDNITLEMYVNNIMSKYLNRCICNIVDRIAKKEGTIRILEVGAGTGATTGQVLEAVKGRDVEYFFTDCTSFFITGAKKKFENYQNVTYKVLDIDKPIKEQGFVENYFDVIIAVGVLENAKDIRYSLQQIRSLSKAGGYFLFTEPVLEEPWILSSQGFLMTKPEDELRKNQAFISEDTWLACLEELESGNTQIYPQKDHKMRALGLTLFVKPLKHKQKHLNLTEVKEELKNYVPPYMIPMKFQEMDQVPLTANGKVDKKYLREQVVKGMVLGEDAKNFKMTELEEKVSKVLSEVGISNLSTNESFYDHGADSLIMAKAAGKIREEFAKEVAFDSILRQMLNYPTIANTAQFIEENTASNSEGKEKQDTVQEFADSNGVFNFYGGGEERLRVVFHAAFGTMNCFRFLLPKLVKQNKGQVVGVSIKDSEKYISIDPDEVVLSLADDYAEQIANMGYQKVQLIGYCYSGWIAIEIGNRLMERGIEVEDIVLIDSQLVPFKVNFDFFIELLYLPNIYVDWQQVGIKDPDLFENAIDYLVKKNGYIPEDSLKQLSEVSKYTELVKEIEEITSVSIRDRFVKYVEISEQNTGNPMDADMALSLYKTYKHTFCSVHYEAHPYIGDFRYVLAKEFVGMYYDKDKTLDYWENLCLGDFTLETIDGNHYTCVESEEHATDLAVIIENGIKE